MGLLMSYKSSSGKALEYTYDPRVINEFGAGMDGGTVPYAFDESTNTLLLRDLHCSVFFMHKSTTGANIFRICLSNSVTRMVREHWPECNKDPTSIARGENIVENLVDSQGILPTDTEGWFTIKGEIRVHSLEESKNILSNEDRSGGLVHIACTIIEVKPIVPPPLYRVVAPFPQDTS